MESNIVRDDQRFILRIMENKTKLIQDKWFGTPKVNLMADSLDFDIHGDPVKKYGFVMSFVNDRKYALVMESASHAFFVFLTLQPVMEERGFTIILEEYEEDR